MSIKRNNIVIKKDYAIIEINNNKLGLLHCMVDLDDLDVLSNYYWNIRYDNRHPNCTVYVETHKRINGKNTRIHMHKLITNCPKELEVDHINGNGLDNRKQNLRCIPHSLNTLNKNHKYDVGVRYNKRDNVWIASFNIKGKTIYAGYYRTKEEAINRRKYINSLIKSGDLNTLESIKCEKVTPNNSTGYRCIYKLKSNGKYQVRPNGVYLGTYSDLYQAVEVLNNYYKKIN